MIRFFTVFSILVLACSKFLTAGETKTNVVFILIDDLSHYGVSAYGADKISAKYGEFEHATIATPEIDKLAEEGMMCANAFAYPLCEPTRIALMSGKYNSRNFLKCKSQHDSDVTFGDVFQKNGYATGIFGKWKQTRGTKEIPGKDYIFEFGWDEFCCFDVVGERQRFINPNLVINGKIHNYEGRTDLDPITGRRWYGPDICNRHALEFIEKNKDKPFFLYYPMLLVHDEHQPTPATIPASDFDNFNKRKKNGFLGDDKKYFPDMIHYMDLLIGKVVTKLDELGIRENTLIVVMGDNGTKETFTHILPDGSLYPGGKGGTYDNGLHVPLVFNQPATIKKGKAAIRQYQGLVDVVDIFPTLCDAVGIELPNRNDLDGIGFWPQVLGNKNEVRDVIYTWYNNNQEYTSDKELLVYAFDKNFKRYAPSEGYPEGRFFDLREDRLELGGDRYVKRRFNHRSYSGLDFDELNEEQTAAFNRLGKVIDSYKYVSVESLQIEASSSQFKVGETVKLKCRVLPDQATRKNIVWKSSDPQKASINKFGELTLHKKGKVTVSVYSWDDAFPIAANTMNTFSTDGIQSELIIEIE